MKRTRKNKRVRKHIRILNIVICLIVFLALFCLVKAIFFNKEEVMEISSAENNNSEVIIDEVVAKGLEVIDTNVLIEKKIEKTIISLTIKNVGAKVIEKQAFVAIIRDINDKELKRENFSIPYLNSQKVTTINIVLDEIIKDIDNVKVIDR